MCPRSVFPCFKLNIFPPPLFSPSLFSRDSLVQSGPGLLLFLPSSYHPSLLLSSLWYMCICDRIRNPGLVSAPSFWHRACKTLITFWAMGAGNISWFSICFLIPSSWHRAPEFTGISRVIGTCFVPMRSLWMGSQVASEWRLVTRKTKMWLEA